MKRRNGEVLAICEHSKVNISGVDMSDGKKGGREKGKEGGSKKESKL